MKELTPKNNKGKIKSIIGSRINIHLEKLNKSKKSDKQKILELCQIGKFLGTYFPDFVIKEVREQPDFLISNGEITIGLEHELIVDSKIKAGEGFYQNICFKVESELKKDSQIPNVLVNCFLKDNLSYKIKDKQKIFDTYIHVIKEFILKDILVENPLIEDITKMPHSQISINSNFGAFIARNITREIILEFVAKKEVKINRYIENTNMQQWLVLLIGGVNESSYDYVQPFEVSIKTKFDKVFLYQDFENKLHELK